MYVFIRRNGSLKKLLIIRNELFFVVKLRPTTWTTTSKSKTFIHWMEWKKEGKMMKTQRKEIIWWWNSEWHLFSDDQMTLWQWQWNGMTMYNEVNLYNTLYNAMYLTWIKLRANHKRIYFQGITIEMDQWNFFFDFVF